MAQEEPKFKIGDLVINALRPTSEEIFEIEYVRIVNDHPTYDVRVLYNGQMISLVSQPALRAVKVVEIAKFRKKYPKKLR